MHGLHEPRQQNARLMDRDGNSVAWPVASHGELIGP